MSKPGTIAFLLSATCVATQVSAGLEWPVEFTLNSNSDLIALHERIHEPLAQELVGVAVKDLHWTEDYFDLHLISGVLYLEPAIEGYPAGAFFSGEATFSFDPQARQAREELEVWMGQESLADRAVSHVYFFTLRGKDMLQQLGVEVVPSLTLEDARAYQQLKTAFRHLGLVPVHEFLNRDGRSRGTAHVLLPLPSIRKTSEKACLCYSFDPAFRFEVTLSVFGHNSMSTAKLVRNRFWPVAELHSKRSRYVPEGRVSLYSTELNVTGLNRDVAEETTITFKPAPGVRALRLMLTPTLEVLSIRDSNGQPLPFLQWQDLLNRFKPDRSLLVDFGSKLGDSPECRLTVKSSGPLFESIGADVPSSYDPYRGTMTTFAMQWLREEDDWHPRLDDPDGTTYELFLEIPKKYVGVAAGELIEESVEGKTRRYHFRTTRPHKLSTLYFGDLKSRKTEADATTVEVFVDERDTTAGSNLPFVTTEIANAVRVYGRILVPLDIDYLRVVATPTYHGRGFEGLLLLSRYGFQSYTALADTFRAHEVAHQWWGNIVQPKDWPTDRWLSESFAEYMALEYYRIRFEGSEKYKEQIHNSWIRPLFQPLKVEYKNLEGQKTWHKPEQIMPISSGSHAVYNKGPLVVHMLRYMFHAVKGGDAPFWELLRDFLQRYQYQRVSSEEFMALAEQHLGMELDWFWDQWLYRTEIPRVKWSYEVKPFNDQWKVKITARQKDTDFKLVIPVRAHLANDQVATKPLILDGSGEVEFLLAEKPSKVTLNDYYEALVILSQ